MNSSSVIVNILVNANNTTAINQWNVLMNTFSNSARNAARQSALSFDSIFGANFFANLASSMVTSFSSGFTKLISDSIQASSKMQSAFVGLESLGRNTGLLGGEASDAVRNLDLVKRGLLSVSDAATSVKNLLASGFSLPEAIELVKRFADTAAFGRQASLSFGYAISSATEGIKNSNSILVDNAGVTKNLSVIMKEAGKSEQDLMKVRTDSSVRLALYNGLIKETKLQQGDATKVLETYQGKMIQLDSAYNRFLAKLGDTVTKSTVVNGVLSATVKVLDFLGASAGSVIALATAIGILTAAIIAMNTSAISSLPVIGTLISTVRLLGQVMVGTASLTAGATATTIAATAGWAALVIALGAIVYAIYNYSTAQKEATKITEDSVLTLAKQRDTYLDNVKVIENVNASNISQADKMNQVNTMYQALDASARLRVQSAADEGQGVAKLAEEYKKLADEQSRKLQLDSNINVQNLVSKAQEINNLRTQAESIRQEIIQRQKEAQYYSSLDPNQVTGTEFLTGSGYGAVTRQKTASEDLARVGFRIDALQSQWDKLNNSTDEGAKSIANAQKEFDNLNKTQGITNLKLGQTTEGAIRQAYEVRGLADQADAAIQAFRQAQGAQSNLGNQFNSTTNAIVAQIEAIKELDTALKRNSGRRQFIEEQIANIAEQSGGDVSKGRQMLKEQLPKEYQTKYGVTTLESLIEQTKQFDQVNKKLNEDTFPKTERKTRKLKSEYDSLSDGVKKASAEVKSFQDLNSREFALRFQKEDLERMKRDFETILNLRHELGMPLNIPLSADSAKYEIEYLERVKKLRDDVLKITKEGAEAEDRLMLARIASVIPVVEAQKRADASYYEGIRKRSDAEQQLTADIIQEVRKREMAQTESSRSIATAQAEAYKDFLADQNNRDSERLKSLARLQLMAGGLFSNNPLIPSADQTKTPATQSPVLLRMDKTNTLLQDILNAIGQSSYGSGLTSGGTYESRNAKGASIINLANKLGVNPLDLAMIISFETGGSFDPNRIGVDKRTGKTYQGTFQFGADERRAYNVRPGQSFQDQVENSAYRFFTDRFRKAGRTTQGASGLDLYTTVIAGNPNADKDKQDSNGVSARIGWNRMMREHRNNALRYLRMIDSPITTTSSTVPEGSTQTTVQPQPTVPGMDFSKVIQDYKELNAITEKYLGMKADDKRINQESISSLDQYLQAQKRLKDEGIEGIRLNAIGQDKLNQATYVQVRQVEELAVSESRLNDLRSRESVSVLETLNNAEKARNESSANANRTLIEAENFLQRFDDKDVKILQYLADIGKADVASRTTQAIQSAAVSGNFIDNLDSPEVQRMLNEEFNANRQNRQAGLLNDLEVQKRQMATGGRDRNIEDLEYLKERNSIILETGTIEAKLERDRKLNADQEIQRTRTTNAILNERNDLENRLAQIQVQMSSSGANQQLREQVALQEELLNIRKADLDASEKLVRLQVQMADKQVYHQEQANAKVLEHLNQIDGLTDIYAKAKIQIVDGFFGGIDTFFTKITGKIPILSNILSTFLSSLTKLIVQPFIARVLGLTGSGSGSGNGLNLGGNGGSSGGGLNIGGIIQAILSGRSGGSSSGGSGGSGSGGSVNIGGSGSSIQQQLLSAVVPQFNSPVFSNGINLNSRTVQQMISGASGGSSGSINNEQLQNLVQQNLIQQIGTGSASGGGTVSATGIGGSLLKNGLNLKGIGSAFGAMAPLMGLQLGLGLGRGSTAGSILGGIGGLIGGGIATAFLAPSLLTGILGGTISGVGAGGAAGVAGATTGLGGAAFAFLTNPFTIAGAGALLVGAYLLSRNAQRRRDEKTRSEILVNAKDQLQQLIEQARSGRIDGASALAQAATIRQNYIQQVSQLKSDKVRRIALATVRELDAMIESQLKPAIRAAETASATDNAIVPTFDSGGSANAIAMYQGYGQFTGSGGSSYGDHIPAVLKRNEIVLSPQNIANLGGFDAMRRAGVRGMEQFPRYDFRQPNISSGGSNQPVYNIFAGSEKMANEIFNQVKNKGVARKLRLAVYTGDDDGFLDTVEKGLAGDF